VIICTHKPFSCTHTVCVCLCVLCTRILCSAHDCVEVCAEVSVLRCVCVMVCLTNHVLVYCVGSILNKELVCEFIYTHVMCDIYIFCTCDTFIICMRDTLIICMCDTPLAEEIRIKIFGTPESTVFLYNQMSDRGSR